jgi:hypothetical protein
MHKTLARVVSAPAETGRLSIDLALDAIGRHEQPG